MERHDNRRNDEARNDGFRNAVDDSDPGHDIENVSQGNAVCFGVGHADDSRKGSEEHDRMADRRDNSGHSDAGHFTDFQVLVQFIGYDTDHNTRYDADEGVGSLTPAIEKKCHEASKMAYFFVKFYKFVSAISYYM